LFNTTSKDLDLRKGAISKSISVAAGHELQAECESKYPDGIRQGQVIATSGYRLHCKKVYHGSVQRWDQGAGHSEKVCTIMHTASVTTTATNHCFSLCTVYCFYLCPVLLSN